MIRKKLMQLTPNEPLGKERVAGILDDLFVTRPTLRAHGQEEFVGDTPIASPDGGDEELEITGGEMMIAVGRCNPKKAVGVEGIPGKVIRVLAARRPGVLLDVLNGINRRGRIPAVWKEARVVLIPKPGRDMTTSSTYRPISILPALSKVWEHTIKMLMERSIGRDPFQKDQYGFRRKRGTIEALDRTVAVVEECRRKRLVCVMVAFDVKNAFNTSWRKIKEELVKRRLPGRLLGIMQDYLAERRILLYTRDGVVRRNVYAGVP